MNSNQNNQLINEKQSWWTLKFRNRLSGFLFGRYNIKSNALSYLSNNERYVNGTDIIYWGEELYILLIILFFVNLYFVSVFLPLILLPLIYVPALLFLATQLELVMITEERLLIEKRSLIEKLTRTQSFQSIYLDQIAMLSFSRAPLNLSLLLLSIFLLIIASLPIIFLYLDLPFLSFDIFEYVLILLFIICSILLLWFSLRLTRRSIELSVIGIPKSIGIGRSKGIPVWFLKDLQNILTERIHHTFHDKKNSDSDEYDLEVNEFPLQYSSLVKDIVKEAGDSLAKELILQIDKESLDIQQIYDSLPHYTTDHVDAELNYLKSKTIIVYNSMTNHWELNRNYKRRYLHEESQKNL